MSHSTLQSCARLLAGLTLLIALSAPADAFTGGGDDCANPDVITSGSVIPVTTVGATLGSVTPPCGTIAKDVWFRWTPSQSGTARIETCAFGTGNSLLAVYAGAGCPTAPSIACSDDYCSPRSGVVFLANAGSSYMIQVGVVGAGEVGGQLYLTLNPLVLNDECSIATPIVGEGSFPVTTFGASIGPTPTPTQCDTAQSDVWYSWIATSTGTCTISTCGSIGDGHSVIGVWAGSDCATATYVSCGYASCGFQAATAFPVTAGTPYLIQLGGLPFGGSLQYSGTFRVTVAQPEPNDDCATPLAISGPGPHPFDLSLATTGVQGQGEGPCFGQDGPAMERDLWFRWTASTTGVHSLSTCNVTTSVMDTKLVVYAGIGCPSANSALACNDQACDSLSELCFPAVAGATYTFQVGVDTGNPGLPGAFVVIADSGSNTNDDCTTPIQISGPGPHPFDTTGATAGCAGQDNDLCFLRAIEEDVWFAWTAAATGIYVLSTCGAGNTGGARVAVYTGGGCPLPGSAVGCSQPGACGPGSLEARVCFAAQAGTVYAIQVGSAAYGTGHPGSFTIERQPAPAECQYDDGTSESAAGLYLVTGGVLWMHRFGAPGMTTTIGSVSAAFGSPIFSTARPSNGASCFVAVWDDPDDDGDPSNAVLLQRVNGAVANSATDILNTFVLPTPQVVHGVYFVGAGMPSAGGSLPAPLDRSSCSAATVERSWFVANVGGIVNATNLNANSIPPGGGGGQAWLLRADCTTDSGTIVCAGDGSGTACPCANTSSVPGTGCKHSKSDALYAGSGAGLRATGSPSLLEDRVRLHAFSLPASTIGLFFQGTTESAAVFGDGLRCTNGAIVRIAQRQASAGSVDYGNGVGADAPLHDQGGVHVTGTRVYQLWYRNAESYCTPSGFNLTNGLRLVWSN